MANEPELYDTEVVTLEPGQQLIVKAAHRTVSLVHKRSGLHFSDQKDGRRGPKVSCHACSTLVYSTGCVRTGCPVREGGHVYSKS